jgi:hypothetical protein
MNRMTIRRRIRTNKIPNIEPIRILFVGSFKDHID